MQIFPGIFSVFFLLLVSRRPYRDNLFMFPSLPLMVWRKKNLFFCLLFPTFWLHWKMVYWGCPGLHLVMLPLLSLVFFEKIKNKTSILISLPKPPIFFRFVLCVVGNYYCIANMSLRHWTEKLHGSVLLIHKQQ